MSARGATLLLFHKYNLCECMQYLFTILLELRKILLPAYLFKISVSKCQDCVHMCLVFNGQLQCPSDNITQHIICVCVCVCARVYMHV